ncbi:hypothetical protein DFQ27_009790 [Actinomortierella ambigua]|uniref:Uncharacterized protein n=1 Tax=Actinomortierella ambigua TaxID=1343610 RepID=A0A9P6QHM4_9FUNG|nr:hypothetical protein DFQ27_009790 [Actinomortierella ambigua]
MTEQDQDDSNRQAILEALERNKKGLQEIEHMQNALNDVRSSVHHTFHVLQGRSQLETASDFWAGAKFTYSSLECLAKLALNSDALLNETQTLQLPKLDDQQRLELANNRKQSRITEDRIVAKEAEGEKDKGWKTVAGLYAGLNIDATLRKFNKRMKKSGKQVRVSKLEAEQALLPVVTLKIDGWEESSHFVFKKITQIAVGAVDHFSEEAPQALLGCILEWLAGYDKLFSTPCVGCGKHLYFDSQQFKHLPATLYTYTSLPSSAFHPQCRR